MDKVFKEIMGIDIEVYVDDMVVKSIEAAGHYRALEREALTSTQPREMLIRGSRWEIPWIYVDGKRH
ncbi:hypothetical protein CR513_36522, partial [Mucuna pruriens]